MAKYLHPDVLDNGPALIKSAAAAMHVIKAYALEDSYATVIANSVGNASMTSADYTLSSGASLSRLMTTAAGKTAPASASSGAGPDLHIAFLDTAGSRVLWVTDETTDLVVTAGVSLTFPQLVLSSPQPT
jgi:hypothetical protein